MNAVMPAPVAILGAPQQDKLLIPFAKSIVVAFTGNPSLPDPRPTLLVVADNVEQYEKSQMVAWKRGWGAATLRDGWRRKVMADLNHLRDYLQSVVELLCPEEAAAVIVGAGMRIKQRARRFKEALRARNTGVSGSVSLEARAVAAVAIYYWEFSLDQENWAAVPEALKSSAVVSGLTPMRTYYFRFHARTRKGDVGLSQVVSLFVF
jgi:hypothetical protein